MKQETTKNKAAGCPPIVIRRGELKVTMIPSKRAAAKVCRSESWLSKMSQNGHINRYRYQGEIHTNYYREDELSEFINRMHRMGNIIRPGNEPSIQVCEKTDKKNLAEEIERCEQRIAGLIDRLTTLFLRSEDYDQMQQQYAAETVRHKRLTEELHRACAKDHAVPY